MTQLIPLTTNQIYVLLTLYKKPEDGYHVSVSLAKDKLKEILTEEEVDEAVEYLEGISAVKDDLITPKGKSMIASRQSFSLDLFAEQLANNPKLFKRMVSLLTAEAKKQQAYAGKSNTDDAPSPQQGTGDTEGTDTPETQTSV